MACRKRTDGERTVTVRERLISRMICHLLANIENSGAVQELPFLAEKMGVELHGRFALWGAPILLLIVLILFWFRDRIASSVTVLIGVAVALLCGFTTFDRASASIDLNALFLIMSMMICTHILSESGFFEWAVIGMTKLLKGNVLLILFFLLFLCMLFSAFLDNVTTVMLMIPLAIIIARVLEIPVEATLLSVLLSANIGSMATLLGSPANMILGAQTELTFNDFLLNALPCAVGLTAVFFVFVVFRMSGKLLPPAVIRTRVSDFCPSGAIVNLKRMRSAFAVFLLMI